ncbi:WecB/TagA/CpsF family glycosyltransferase [Pseudoalteromonas sp. SWXJ133]|uniref:WecB/TagA/CpsF family glycosyltransferase n=1 Tax=Pseudoalteromonas sp. SWXJ133 TaxID=2792069 RepID=UPI0018CDDD1B|nr:WecB/TagA/CpsF family glycosyltransferase [Pseudoalteromonas sp. SWXJ133]MBH0019001.1 WecB/TagA/CpsF family glycosyltransferase [Pseudoalteromonas sp. SWXJ133]
MFDILVDKVRAEYRESKTGNVSFLNPYSYYIGRKNRDLYAQLDDIYIDGQLMVKVLGLCGMKGIKRVSFDATSLAPVVFENCSQHNKSVYVIGAKEEQIPLSVEALKKQYPLLNIVGYSSGYFKSDEHRQEIIEGIKKLNPSVVVVGMGAVHQERFLNALKVAGWKGAGYTCGGFLHQIITGVDYYPLWADKYNMRWVYRIYDEPKLFKRYFFEYPIALFYIFTDFLKFKAKQKNDK